MTARKHPPFGLQERIHDAARRTRRHRNNLGPFVIVQPFAEKGGVEKFTARKRAQVQQHRVLAHAPARPRVASRAHAHAHAEVLGEADGVDDVGDLGGVDDGAGHAGRQSAAEVELVGPG